MTSGELWDVPLAEAVLTLIGDAGAERPAVSPTGIRPLLADRFVDLFVKRLPAGSIVDVFFRRSISHESLLRP